MARSIIVCLDGSKESFQALDFYTKNIAIKNDDLTLLNVRSIDQTLGIHPMEQFENEMPIEKQRMVLKAQNEMLLQASKTCPGARRVGLVGDARTKIVEYCNDNPPDMLLVGSAGKDFIQRQLLGSVSEYLLHHLECPVLITRNISDCN